MELSFGQPLGSIVQHAYVVRSIDRAAADYVDRLGIGPWFVRGPFAPSAGRYRGQPTSAVITLARAFSGHVMLELVEHTPAQEQVYETIYRASVGWDGDESLRRSEI